jgi:hypothetical protein
MEMGHPNTRRVQGGDMGRHISVDGGDDASKSKLGFGGCWGGGAMTTIFGYRCCGGGGEGAVDRR